MFIFILLVFFSQKVVFFSRNVVSRTETPRSSVKWLQCPVDAHYYKNYNKCYKYFGAGYKHEPARMNCEYQLNGYLMTVDSAEKHQIILDIMAADGKVSKKGIRIGLHTTDTMVYKWYTGPFNSTGYSNWVDGIPGVANTNRIVYLDKTSMEWVTKNAVDNTNRNYMCESDPSNKTLGELFPLCPYGYRFSFNKTCYRIYDEHVIFDAAVEQCKCQGGRLVKVDSQEEFDFLYPEVITKSKKSWVALHKRNQTDWTWLDGTVHSGMPSVAVDPANHECATMSTYHPTMYNARNCETHAQYALCEIPQYEPSKQAVCLEGNTGYSNLFDGDAATCEEPPQKGFNFVEIKNGCLNNCSTEVRIVVTLDNADSCSGLPIYYEDVLDCGKPYWSICPLVADHLSESSECEILCHCHNSTMENCNLLMKKPTKAVPDGYSICEVNLV